MLEPKGCQKASKIDPKWLQNPSPRSFPDVSSKRCVFSIRVSPLSKRVMCLNHSKNCIETTFSLVMDIPEKHQTNIKNLSRKPPKINEKWSPELQNRASKKRLKKTPKNHANCRKWVPKGSPLGDQKADNEPRVATLLRPGSQNDSKTTPKSPRDPPKPRFWRISGQFGKEFA